nr:MAG TPA: hypothetical protein [Caudoviricetes sp.]
MSRQTKTILSLHTTRSKPTAFLLTVTAQV